MLRYIVRDLSKSWGNETCLAVRIHTAARSRTSYCASNGIGEAATAFIFDALFGVYGAAVKRAIEAVLSDIELVRTV
jgi:hypothetical protein